MNKQDQLKLIKILIQEITKYAVDKSTNMGEQSYQHWFNHFKTTYNYEGDDSDITPIDIIVHKVECQTKLKCRELDEQYQQALLKVAHYIFNSFIPVAQFIEKCE